MKVADIPQWENHQDSLPLPAWHEQALAEDAKLYESNPAEGSPWAEVKARITR